MKFLLPALALFVFSGCTTLVNRRDLYSPDPGPEVARPVTVTQTTTTRTETREVPKFR